LRTAVNHWLLFARLFPNLRSFEGVYYYRHKHDDRVREVDWVSGACMMVRRSVIDEIGPLSEQAFMYAEDHEWCARMRQKGWKIFHVPEAVVEHRHGASFEQNPQIAALPYEASRKLFVHLNNPSRLKVLSYDIVVTLGLTMRAVGEFVRSLRPPRDRRDIRRQRAQKFLSDAKLTMANVGRPG
jgi:N-acetylglucosaminyl-diphospho-decaprenol L-rhamnosyltransferase